MVRTVEHGPLTGKIAIVSGGARSTGLQASRSLAALGACVVVADDAAGDDAAAEALGDAARVIHADPAGDDGLLAAVGETVDEFGRVDILINAAGEGRVPPPTRWTEISDADWSAVLATQAKAAWLGCRAVAPVMKQQRSGRIVNIGSSAVQTGTPGFLAYVTAKSSLLGATRSIARELGPFNVAVNMVIPEPQVDDGAVMGGSPVVPRPSLEPGHVDLSGALEFLCGDGVGFITGQSWIVDRGRLMQ